MELLAFAVLFFIAVFEIPPSESSDERIVGGEKTTIEKYPYQLSLGYVVLGHICGASLIRPNIALTAAHCTHLRSPNMYTVRANSSRLNHGGIVVAVADFCEHPKYTPVDYDVTVVLLDRSLPLGPGIQTIPLQEVGIDVEDGTYGTVTGWGHLKFNGSASDVLQEVKLPQVNSKVCKMKLKWIAPTTSRMVCYGYDEGGRDFCQGDSGGPLAVDGKQVGIVSWGGDKCAEANIPGVYTKISNKAIHEHIDTCIEKFSKSNLC